MAENKAPDQSMIDLFKGFSKLDRQDRLARLVQMGALQPEDVEPLNRREGLDPSLAEKFIENVIGYFQMPLGVAANFVIDGRSYAIPMAVEETSIIAAASKTAKWILEHGHIETEIVGRGIIGQIQMDRVADFSETHELITAAKDRLIKIANEEPAKGLVARGGGVFDLQIRRVPREDGQDMAVVHVVADTCDAMGANIINQVCEYLKPHIEILTGETVNMCILSNLSDSKITRAKVVLHGLDAELMDKVEKASLFAQRDPYRACTNNKGVLNGIDPILLATGNDWRAVEAGVHAFAAKTGVYSSITRWSREGDQLIGIFEAPIMLGVVGGVTKLHPTAQMSLRMLGVSSADELARICAAVGLVQNLGALRALTTVGIIEGHMKLHIQNLTIGAGAQEKEIPYVQKRLEEILSLTKRISLSQAVEVLKELRSGNAASPVAVPLKNDSSL